MALPRNEKGSNFAGCRGLHFWRAPPSAVSTVTAHYSVPVASAAGRDCGGGGHYHDTSCHHCGACCGVMPELLRPPLRSPQRSYFHRRNCFRCRAQGRGVHVCSMLRRLISRLHARTALGICHRPLHCKASPRGRVPDATRISCLASFGVCNRSVAQRGYKTSDKTPFNSTDSTCSLKPPRLPSRRSKSSARHHSSSGMPG